MWVFSRAGFFSAVEKGNKKGQEVCVRARVLEDFDRLRKLYYPEMGTVERSYNTDYPYRIYVSHDAWARVMAAMSKDINYANFKGMVAKEQGEERAHLYSDVWAVMYGAEQTLAEPVMEVSGEVTGVMEDLYSDLSDAAYFGVMGEVSAHYGDEVGMEIGGYRKPKAAKPQKPAPKAKGKKGKH
jgi:hypothetical protein